MTIIESGKKFRMIIGSHLNIQEDINYHLKQDCDVEILKIEEIHKIDPNYGKHPSFYAYYTIKEKEKEPELDTPEIPLYRVEATYAPKDVFLYEGKVYMLRETVRNTKQKIRPGNIHPRVSNAKQYYDIYDGYAYRG